MHLAELLRLRTRPGAGLLLALTERCPLSCAHCSTRSAMDAEQHPAMPFRRIVDSFSPADHPEIIFMSGGEPLLRPRLVADLASQGHVVGTGSAVLSGLFFARSERMPAAIRTAISAVDHFSASVDEYHEREVSRQQAFAALRRILDLVPAVSVHTASSDESYVDDLVAGLRRTFGVAVPALVTRVQPTGRALSFLTSPSGESTDPMPCEFAAWPLVDYDGTVLACSRQTLARMHRPPHLILGHAARDTWPEIRSRTQSDPLLRAIRVVGPVETARRMGSPTCSGICSTCVTLRDDGSDSSQVVSPELAAVASQLMASVRPRDLARQWGSGRHADLVELGWGGPA